MIRTHELGISAICSTPLIFLALSFCQEIHSSTIQTQPKKEFSELTTAYLPGNELSFQSNPHFPFAPYHEYPMISVFLSENYQ